MNFEGKSKKSEQTDFQENKTEKELSLSEIDSLIKEKADIFDSLDKFSKDEFYKTENFEDSIMTVDSLNDNFDESAYAKAGFFQKFDNFTRFGLHKKNYGLLKSKERGLLDKTEINENIVGKNIDIGQDNKKEREYLESNLIDIKGDFKKDTSERMVFKRFEKIDGKIIKIIESKRTERGEIEAAGKKREAEISRLETVNGTELVGLKEAMERNAKSKESLLGLSESMTDEEKERVTLKLNEEESQTNEKIKEKEEKLAEETNKFREPLEGRLKETIGIENDLKEALDFVKDDESELKEQIKKCEENIKKSKKLSLLGDVGNDVVKIFEDKKVAFDAQAKEYAEKRNLLSSKLEVLKNNKKEIEATLNRVNNIGKTKQEMGFPSHKLDNEWIKNETERTKGFTKADHAEDILRDMLKTHNPYSETFIIKPNGKFDKILRVDGAPVYLGYGDTPEELYKIAAEIEKKYPEYHFSFKTDDEGKWMKYTVLKTEKEEKEKIWDETRDEVWGLKNTAEEKEKINQNETEQEIEVEENAEEPEKIFTKEEIVEIVMKELKVLGIMSIKDRTMREQITNNVKMAVEAMIAKSKEPVEENDLKKEVKDWYKKFRKNNSKKNR